MTLVLVTDVTIYIYDQTVILVYIDIKSHNKSICHLCSLGDLQPDLQHS